MIEVGLSALVFVGIVLALAAFVLAARRRLLPEGGVPVTLNGARELSGPAGGTLLETLLEAGIAIPAACGGKGTCGLCRVQAEDGAGPVLPTEAGRLSRADLHAGTRLACQLRLREPMAIRIDPAMLDVQSHRARVVSTRALTPTIKEIVFDVPPGWEFDFTAGGFVLVTAPAFRLALSEIDMAPLQPPAWATAGLVAQSSAPISRAYSVANRPEDRGRIVFNIRLALPPPTQSDLPPGLVSSWLFGLKPGDSAELSGPFGEFHATDTDVEMVIVGGGVGMAPLRAIVHDQLARGTGRKITYFFGARGPDDLFYAGEFEALAAQHKLFTWVPVLSEKAGSDWPGETGFVHQTLIRRHLDSHPAPETCEYYLCGPPVMIRAVTAALDAAGVEKSQIHFDDFGE